MGKNNKTQPLPSFRNLYAFGKKLPIDLSLSENPLGCSPLVIAALRQVSLEDCFDYPDPDCSFLKDVMAKQFRLSQNNLFVTNGSEALIKLIPQVVLNPGDEVLIPALTFPMFAIASQLSGGQIVLSNMTQDFDIDLDDLQNKLTRRTKLVFLCNPNNPTGKIIPKQQLLAVLQATAAMVVVDEANIEFGGESLIQEVNRFNNLVVLRTFSKGFGLAGFRIGFCAASKDLIATLQRNSQPFPVSALAQKAAVAAFRDQDFIKQTKVFMKQERDFLSQGLKNRGLAVIESQANNLLIKLPISSTSFVQQLNNNGVSVVDGAAFGLGRCVRVSPRLRQINEQFLEVVDVII